VHFNFLHTNTLVANAVICKLVHREIKHIVLLHMRHIDKPLCLEFHHSWLIV